MSKAILFLGLLAAAIAGMATARADPSDQDVQQCLSVAGAGPRKLSFTNNCKTPIRVFYKLHGAAGSKMLDLGPGASQVVEFSAGGSADWAVCGPGETAYEGDTNTPWIGLAGTHTCK